ncbi:hypothetical protein ACKWTF_006885 [Chironomus riparius]
MVIRIFLILFFICAIPVYGLSDKNINQRKAKLIEIFNQDAAHHSHSSSWESRERRRIQRMGYYDYCAAYPYRDVCRYPSRYANRYNSYRYPANRYPANRYPYRYYTTPVPFPFNLFGKK